MGVAGPKLCGLGIDGRTWAGLHEVFRMRIWKIWRSSATGVGHSLKRLAWLLCVLTPLAAWFLVKPVRVVAPQLFGLACPSEVLCVDDPSQAEVAMGLYAEAMRFVADTVTPIAGHPRLIFCSTASCAEAFGLGARSAVTVANAGTVIGPRAWKPYYVRHELIHYLQCERLGAVPLLFKPAWFVEGMAYGLSEDPRAPLAEPFEAYRRQFLGWYSSISPANLWAAGRKL